MTRKHLLLLLPAALGLAANSGGIDHFSAAQFKERQVTLTKAMKEGLASEVLATYGNHLISQAHRAQTGQAEFHEKQADVLFSRVGKASIVIGGKVVNGKTTAPGEIRGTSIEGGQKFSFNPGDVVHIPVRTAHQIVLEPGQTIDYMAVKVDVQ